MPTARVQDSRRFLNGPRLRNDLRYDAIERGVGGVEGTGQVGCVEDVSDPSVPELQCKLGNRGGGRDGLRQHDRVRS
jgi:hypothetical protein